MDWFFLTIKTIFIMRNLLTNITETKNIFVNTIVMIALLIIVFGLTSLIISLIIDPSLINNASF